ncbi:Argonaute siRNA chaperone complex subunit Arb1-domain-containing protein [Mucor mucedo]|uniref:Argonaute siRNA chaperone complex subunit Arb1-domain-containing protein n=1 Tax=Mucor mucedo TaxID=29922 RepID=UPI00221ED65B|nr:Argonaute siRNA chaperone complex subunit Arb1-domain-containing protein [Mucor mucedo]KAI7867901.1 Argonaute siRNA chaperone complex subunit Arb1-domain-containing protein [Mucor mucedo]
MEDNTQEGREQLMQEYLNQTHIADDDEELIERVPEDGAQLEEEIDVMPTELSTPISLMQKKKTDQDNEKKKKKRKKKSKTANLPEAGTELPDDYVEKHAEDVVENPFDPERPLSQRIEYAIMKYRKNHKFSGEKKAIFDNYLKFGGINTGPNMFLGRATSADRPDDPDAEFDFDAAKTAIDSVPDELEEGVEVNFTEVAQVYFSNTFIRESRFISLQDFVDAPVLIDAFLRYLQIRNVAPEYAEDIANARAIVGEAKIQLPKCKRISGFMPGNYNKACASLFGALESDMDTSWMTEATMKIQKQFLSFVVETIGTNSDDSKKIVKAHIKDPDNVRLVETKEWVFAKIAEIAPYSETAAQDDLIKVTFENKENSEEKFDIFLEKKIVDFMMIGMVTRATFCKLSNGDWYLEGATRVMPSFYMEDDCMVEEDLDF